MTSCPSFRPILGLLVAATLLTAPSWARPSIALVQLSTYESGIFDEGAAEIVAHDPKTQRLFVINAEAAAVDVLSIADPFNPAKLFSIDATPYGDVANSVAVDRGLVAVAIQADPATDPGKVVFFDVDGNYLNDVTVGALPDMVTFTPNGQKVLVANEGEPNDDYTVDPVGSVSIVDLRRGASRATVTTTGFEAFNGAVLDPNIRIFGPGATVAQDLEPEYIAVSHNSKTAWVVAQENNALAVLDLEAGQFSELVGLGFKDHSLPGNELDPSDRDDAINIQNWPVLGMYQPDAIATVKYKNQTYILSANEGDARDYDGFSEEERIKDITLDPIAFPNAATLQMDENLGRLAITTTLGDDDNDGDYDQLYSYGGRSFSVWNESGELVYDSGDALEQITAAAFPADFNSNNDENDSFDSRSDAKGPEPEGIVVGKAYGRSYAFIGLERMGGILVYDVTVPFEPRFVQYVNNRDFADTDVEDGGAGDLGPEGLLFIPAGKSPTRFPLLVVGNEVSGTTTLWELRR